MQIPKYWDEAVLRHKQGRRRLTMRRWGWSQVSQDEAKAHAQQRVEKAMEDALLTWPKEGGFFRRELKVPYNGAEGVPIREEVIIEKPEGVVTRNSYGALCLNVDDVMFVDVDNDDILRLPVGTIGKLGKLALIGALFLAASSWLFPHFNLCAQPVSPWGFAIKSFFFGFPALWIALYWTRHAWHVWTRTRSGLALGAATRAVQRILEEQPGAWRIYQSPNGARIMAMHALHDPASPDTQELMRRLHADPLYAAMCRRQNCFRARVSAKPWRIPGVERMRGPVWPVSGEALDRRLQWVAGYEISAPGYAACRLVMVAGDASVDPKAVRVQQWHDDLSQSDTGKPLA